MKPETIHHLNTGLIILSCIVSFFVPFELFLFSYTLLGPLHYLTEIGWLHKNNYFTKGKYDFILLGIACALLIYWNFNPPEDYGLKADLIFISLFSCIAFVFIKDWLYRIVLIVLAFICVAFINDTDTFFIWMALFIPTIIHVFIFTLAFMIYGVLKNRSFAGHISIIVFIISSLLLLLIQPLHLNYEVSAYVRKIYDPSGDLNYQLLNLFKTEELNDFNEIFTTNAGFVVMRFIAFAYTYHYLNWFSKTSVIQWHKVSKKALTVTFILWITCLLLYFYSYDLALKVLLFLSLLHVFLEFPLNILSFNGIGRALIRPVRKSDS